MVGTPDDADDLALQARYRWRRFVVAIAALALAGSALFGVSTPSLAAPGVYVDVQPEEADVAVGATVTLTATVRDDDQPTSNANVRWYFGADSPNDPEPHNSSPDLQCSTNAGGTCSVSYRADAVGSDAICALVSGGPSSCDEAADAPEWANNADVVLRHVIAGDGTPPSTDPTPSPSPSLSPIAQPTSTPTPGPTTEPSPSTTLEPTPTVEPTPTIEPTPAVEPSPTLEPVRTAAPTPAAPEATAMPTPIPTIHPTPAPTALPVPQPTLDERPTPTPIERPAEVPTPSAKDEPATLPGSSGPTPPPDDAGASGNPAPVLPTPEQHADRVPEPSSAAEVPAPRVLEPEVAEVVREPDPASNAGADVVRQPAREVTAPAPAQPQTPARPDDVVSRIVDAAIGGVASVVRPAAAAAVAEEFTFPLALTLAVILYLIVQGHIDRRDPKLRLAPQNVIERVLRFQTEDEL